MIQTYEHTTENNEINDLYINYVLRHKHKSVPLFTKGAQTTSMCYAISIRVSPYLQRAHKLTGIQSLSMPWYPNRAFYSLGGITPFFRFENHSCN